MEPVRYGTISVAQRNAFMKSQEQRKGIMERAENRKSVISIISCCLSPITCPIYCSVFCLYTACDCADYNNDLGRRAQLYEKGNSLNQILCYPPYDECSLIFCAIWNPTHCTNDFQPKEYLTGPEREIMGVSSIKKKKRRGLEIAEEQARKDRSDENARKKAEWERQRAIYEARDKTYPGINDLLASNERQEALLREIRDDVE